MKNTGIVRQGDVILIPTSLSAEGEEVKDPRGLVLAEGETSGHYHVVAGLGHKLFQRSANMAERILVVNKGGGSLKVKGDEARHDEIKISEGTYLVRVQRSWTSENASRQVAD